MKKIALITGITGQDGSYLAEYLLSLDYEVHGLILPSEMDDPERYLFNLSNIRDKIVFHRGGLENIAYLSDLFSRIIPHECYHLAGQSFVYYSPEEEFQTMETNVVGTHRLLGALSENAPKCKIFFASSSEVFGNAPQSPQDENTQMKPRNVYGLSKLTAQNLVRIYRKNRKIYACNGILYNHESPRRGPQFVTRKITMAAAEIKLGLKEEIHLGNIDIIKDWGFAGDYVKIMHAMLQQPKPQDFIIGTGKGHTVREFLELSFETLDLDYKKYLVIDQDFVRPSSKHPIVARPYKLKTILNWKREVHFKELVKMMTIADYEALSKHLKK